VTLPLKTAAERFKASAVLAGALQVQACTGSIVMAQLATRTININLASLIAFVLLFETAKAIQSNKRCQSGAMWCDVVINRVVWE
jgi:hypothetical protein